MESDSGLMATVVSFSLPGPPSVLLACLDHSLSRWSRIWFGEVSSEVAAVRDVRVVEAVNFVDRVDASSLDALCTDFLDRGLRRGALVAIWSENTAFFAGGRVT